MGTSRAMGLGLVRRTQAQQPTLAPRPRSASAPPASPYSTLSPCVCVCVSASLIPYSSFPIPRVNKLNKLKFISSAQKTTANLATGAGAGARRLWLWQWH